MKESNQGLARKEFYRVVSVLKKNGYKDTINLFDFWEKNKDQLHYKIYGKDVSDDTFELQVRWYSKEKMEEAKRIRKYIEKKVNDNNALANQQQKVNKVTIDFSDLAPLPNYYTIRTIEKDGNFKEHKLVDLRGICLMKMRLSGCNFMNCSFNAAFFDDSQFTTITFTDCTFSRTSFHRSELISIDMKGISAWSGAYVDGTYLSQISGFDENTLPYPFVTTDITYWQLVLLLYKKIRYSDSKYKENFPKQKFTVYSNVSVDGLKKSEVKELKEYITWFQSWSQRLLNFKTLKRGRKIEFSIALVFTKYWSSAMTFAGVILFFDFMFSCFFFLFSDSFNHLTIPGNPAATFIKSLYYSTVTLLTLGYGDVFPLYWGGQIIVIGEVIIGYVFLGLFLYLISRRVERLY